MKWSLDKIEPQSDWKIQFGDQVLFVGSCFSEHIFQKAKLGGLKVRNTQFGTLFHPLAVARLLKDSIEKNVDPDILERDGFFFSWNASTQFNSKTALQFKETYEEELSDLHDFLRQAKAIFITFGTAWGYRRVSDDKLVANCHKQPGHLFKKENTDLDTLKDEWGNLIYLLRSFNPELEIVFTISPVRHIRDGVVENVRSKARLSMLCEFLTNQLEKVSYFPSYEIVMEELRDYRFFEADLVHPNQTAIQEIWERFEVAYLNEENRQILKEVVKLRRSFTHRTMVPNLEYEKKREEQLQELLEKYPSICWE